MAGIAVVGGGMSGLSLAWFLKELKPQWDIRVLEAGKRAGGKAWTIKEEGFLCEKGVNGVLDNKPSTLGLAERLGVSPLKSNDAARRRFVIKHARLIKLPESPGEFFTSPLLSLGGRLRVLAEMIMPRGNLEEDESLADFARRRLGKSAFEYLIDPMATGIFAGDPERLSLRSCFPRIYELERDYGSLIRAMIRLQMEARRKKEKGPGAGPGGTLTSFRGGMNELVDALTDALGDSVSLNSPVASVAGQAGKWRIIMEDGAEMDATHLVLASPADAVSKILAESVPEVAGPAAKVQYPPVSIVCLGIPEKKITQDLDGFGFLIPGRENRSILGALWDSSIFKGRAPEGYALLRVLVGGARAPGKAGLPDEALLDMVRAELGELMGLEASPDFIRIFRWEKAIPQYNTGHQALCADVESVLRRYPGLYIRCNWMGGVSLNDCVANSEKLARELAEL